MIRFHLFGPPDLRREDGTELRSILAQPKRTALLAYFAATCERGPRRREVVAALFWPELEESRARHAVAKSTHFLRQSLGEGVLVGRGDAELGLDPERFWSDVGAFDRLLRQERWADALTLHERGEFLEGFHLDDAPEFDGWIEGERERLRREAVRATDALVAHHRLAGDFPALAAWQRRRLQLDPYSETALCALMETLARTGDRSGAVAEFDAFSARITRNLELEPGPRAQALREQIHSGLAGAPPSAGASATPSPGPAVPQMAAPGAPPSAMPGIPPSMGPTTDAELSARGGRSRTPRGLAIGTGVAATILWITLWGAPGFVPESPTDASDPAAAEATPVRRVTVLPFRAQGDLSEESAEALATLLVWNLDGAGGISASYATTAASDPAEVTLLAEAMGAGDSVRVRLQVGAAPQEEPRGTVLATGSEAGLFALADELALQVAGVLLGESGEEMLASAATTTASVPALRAFLRGERHFRQGRHSVARDAFEEAVRQDPAFALGFYRLSVSADWAGAPADSVRALTERAWALRERLPWTEGLRLQGVRAAGLGLIAEAETALTRLIELYPADRDAWFQLGELLYHLNSARGRRYGESEQAFRRILEIDSTAFEALAHIARIAASTGDVARMRAVFEKTPSLGPDRLEVRALAAFSMGDERDREGVVRELESLHDHVAWSAIVFRNASHLADPKRAEELMATAVSRGPDAIRARARVARAIVRAAQGLDESSSADLLEAARGDALLAAIHGVRIALERAAPLDAALADGYRSALEAGTTGPEADEEIEPGFGVTRRQAATYGLGLLEARAGDGQGALAHAAELSSSSPLVPGARGILAALAGGIEADVLHARGETQAALERLGPVSREPPLVSAQGWLGSFGRERLLRARLLVALGREAEAIPLLESFPDLCLENRIYEAGAAFELARVHDRAGRRDDALASYRRFVQLRGGGSDPLQGRVHYALQRERALSN